MHVSGGQESVSDLWDLQLKVVARHTRCVRTYLLISARAAGAADFCAGSPASLSLPIVAHFFIERNG